MTLNWERSLNTVSSSSKVIKLPVPYELPPQPYSSEGHVLFNLFSLFYFFNLYSEVYLCHINLVINSEQMFLGLGTEDITRRMCMVKFGHVMFSCTLVKIRNNYFLFNIKTLIFFFYVHSVIISIVIFISSLISSLMVYDELNTKYTGILFG